MFTTDRGDVIGRKIKGALWVTWLAAASVVLATASTAHAEVTRSGTLQATVFDDFRTGQSKIRYTVKSGGRTTVVRPTRLAAEPGDRVAVTGKVRDGRLVGTVEATPGSPRLELTAGPRKVAVVLVGFPGHGAPWSPEQARSRMFTGPTSINAFFQEESHGDISLTGKNHLDGDVFGPFTLGDPGSGCEFNTWEQEADQAAAEAGIDLTGYDHIVYALPRRGSCGWAGIAELNGTRASLNGNVRPRTIAHELGHNLGLLHAGSWTCTSGGLRVQISDNCATHEYGDPFDTMGNIAYRHSNGWNLAKLEILAAENVETVDVSGTYAIRSARDLADEPTVPTVLRVARKRDHNGEVSSWYYLEIRKRDGVFENVTDASTTGVSVRATAEHFSAETLLLDANPATSHFFDAPLGVDQTFDGGPVQITTLAAGGGSATVEVEVDTEPPSAPTDLRADVDAGGVRLSWVGADNVGVERYFVFRDGEQMRSVTTESFLDRRPPVGDHDYVVVAEDESLNQSEPSELTVTVPALSGPTCAEGECKLAYRYTGAPDPATWTVPPGVHGALFTVEGASGGRGGGERGGIGGGGAHIWATLEPLAAGQEVEIVVGGRGERHSEGGRGGFNGGGDGGLEGDGAGGGGHTTVELESKLEVLAAGGGGGGGPEGLLPSSGGTAEDEGSPGRDGFRKTGAHGATLGGGEGGAAGGTGGGGGAGGGVTGSSTCPGGTQDGAAGASGEGVIGGDGTGGGGVAAAGGGGGGGYVGGGQGGGGASDACEASAASGGGGSGSSYVAEGRPASFDSASGGDGWLSIEYDNPIVAPAHSYTTRPDQQLEVDAASGVLAGASGPGVDPLSARVVTPPANGSLTLHGDGSFTYVPEPGYFGGDSFTYEADDPSSDNYAIAEVTLAVAEPPTAAIAVPADEATYVQGQTVNASFACTEGPGGPGISSCTGPVANGEPIDTSATGERTFTVLATSEDGLTGQAAATYTVRPPPPDPEPRAPEPEPAPRTPPSPSPSPPPPSISIPGGLAFVVQQRAEVRLGCDAAAAGICRGTLSLRGRQIGRRPGAAGKAIALGLARYAIPAGESRLIGVRLHRAALTPLRRARNDRLRAAAIATVKGGRTVRRAIVLARGPRRVLVRYRRSGGLAGDTVDLVVAQNGNARLATRSGQKRARLNRRTRTRLNRALRRANLARLEPSYEPAIPAPDAFTHVITHRGHTVRAADPATPPRLRALINILNRVAVKLRRGT